MILITPRQRECLQHRLDFLMSLDLENMSELFEADYGDVLEAIVDVGADVLQGQLTEDPTDVQKDVLVECVEGSTWVAAMTSTATDAEISASQRILERVAEKIESIVGRRVVPA